MNVVLVDHLAVDEVYDLTIFEVFIVRGDSEYRMSFIELGKQLVYISAYCLKCSVDGGSVCVAHGVSRNSSSSIA